MYGFNVITRISRHNDATEEPLYWADYGNRLFRLSQIMDRAEQGQTVAAERAALENEIPPDLIQDFLQRRTRNHQVNRAALELLAEGSLDLLVLSSDDTSTFGLSSAEKRRLQAYAAALGLGDNLLMYPGADEVGGVLLARLINQQAAIIPTFHPIYMVPDGEKITAPFEDAPIRVTVERQIQAAGGRLVSDSKGAEVLLFVNPPIDSFSEWPRDYTPTEKAQREAPIQSCLQQIRQQIGNGRKVAVVDVACANGADPYLWDGLKHSGSLPLLAAFAAWNTAGNSLGTVIAQACAGLRLKTRAQIHAQQRFLLHRYLEDYAYQSLLRGRLRAWLAAQIGQHEPPPSYLGETLAWLKAELDRFLADLPPYSQKYQITQVRLPWQRTFEIDFDLEALPHA
jgi:hypothetical protein